MNLVFNWTTAAMVSVPALLLWFAFVIWGRQQPEEDVCYKEEEEEYYPPEAVAWGITHAPARFVPDQYYHESEIEDLLWSLGYSHQAVKKALNHGFVAIFQEGVSASFEHYGKWDDPIYYRCLEFDPDADTSSVDRWNRTPTDEERRKAVYR